MADDLRLDLLPEGTTVTSGTAPDGHDLFKLAMPSGNQVQVRIDETDGPGGLVGDSVGILVELTDETSLMQVDPDADQWHMMTRHLPTGIDAGPLSEILESTHDRMVRRQDGDVALRWALALLGHAKVAVSDPKA